MRRVAALIFTAACRIAFDEHTDAGSTVPDAKPTCPEDAILCDDFELGDLSKWSGTRQAGSLVIVDGVMPHLGTSSLDAMVPSEQSNGGEAFVYKELSTTYDHLAARAWFYFPDSIESFQGVIYLVDLPTESHYLEVSTDTDGWTVVGNGGALHDYTSTVPVVQQQWTCVEIDLDRVDQRFRLYIGDAVAIDTAIADTAPMFDILGVGATRANADGYHVFTDDVVIATTHVGCD